MKRKENACFNFIRNVFAGPHDLILGVMNVMGDVIRRPKAPTPFVLEVNPFAEYDDGLIETPVPAICTYAIPVEELFVLRGRRYVRVDQAGQLQAGERLYRRTPKGKAHRYSPV